MIELTDIEVKAVQMCLELANQMGVEDVYAHTGMTSDEWSALMQKFGAAEDIGSEVSMTQERAETFGDDLGESPDY